MRVNPITAVRDWSKKKHMKEVLSNELRKHGGPGEGVEVPSDDPLWAVAVMELLREQPMLKAVRMHDGIVLCRRAHFEGGTSAGLKQAMESAGFAVGPGDKP